MTIPPVSERQIRCCKDCIFCNGSEYCDGPGHYTPQIRDDRLIHTNERDLCEYHFTYDEMVELIANHNQQDPVCQFCRCNKHRKFANSVQVKE